MAGGGMVDKVVASGGGGGWRREARWRKLLAGFLASLQALAAGLVVGWDWVDGEDDSWLPSVAGLGTVVGAAPIQHVLSVSHIQGVLAASLQALAAGLVVGWDWVDGEDDSWLPSVAGLGTVVGAAPAGWLADMLGRRTVLLASALPGVTGWTLVAAAGQAPRTRELLYAGRFVSGLSTGVCSVALAMYNCEAACGGPRGSVGSLQFLLYIAGIAAARALTAFAPPLWLPAVAAASHAGAALALAWVPESPLHLVRRGHVAAAEAALARLGAADPARAARRLGDLVADRPTAARLLRVGVVAVGLMMFRQLVGARAVAALSRAVFPPHWLAGCPPALALALTGVLGALLPALCGDAVGRKMLMMSSGAAMAVCHLSLSVFLFVRGAHPGQDLAAVAWLPVASALAHAAAFGAGFGALPWLVVSEVAPPAGKGHLLSLAACANHVLALMFSRAFYGSPGSVHHPVLSLMFCCSCCLGMLFVVLYVPETKRRSLKEVQDLLK
ncbi:solute carrier family 2, facilitated glucose transporter member 8-like [Bacillus rossius redtenbacheri]|uniref:solute carrier family 2, facilitated glucose transporter member 8-like n=1 Tax=Bacillus rossius redtenbacheri TaxID=93214 RepID=UPI002FDD848F